MEDILGGEIVIGGTDGKIKHTDLSFLGCDFESYDPTGVSFDGCQFKNCKFDYLYLFGNTFVDCVFTDCTFISPIFTDIVFEKCWFIKCEISDTYSMDNVTFSDCTFLRITFRDKDKSKHSDSMEFDSCEFDKPNFINYCLDGTLFEDCTLFKGMILKCGLDNVSIFNTVFDECCLQQAHIENSEWDIVKFKNSSWKKITFGDYNKFSAVVLRETSVDGCSGDPKSINSISISPYIMNKETNKPTVRKDTKLAKAPASPTPKRTKAPYRYISEGL